MQLFGQTKLAKVDFGVENRSIYSISFLNKAYEGSEWVTHWRKAESAYKDRFNKQFPTFQFSAFSGKPIQISVYRSLNGVRWSMGHPFGRHFAFAVLHKLKSGQLCSY